MGRGIGIPEMAQSFGPRGGGRAGQGDGDIQGKTILAFTAGTFSLCPGHKNANHVVCGPGFSGSGGHRERVGGKMAPLSSFGVSVPIKRGKHSLFCQARVAGAAGSDPSRGGTEMEQERWREESAKLELGQPIEGLWR